MNHRYYVTVNSRGFHKLRQTRFKELRAEHPHDVCAVAWTLDELRGMIERAGFVGEVDWEPRAEPPGWGLY